jgi:plastocyanin
MRVQLALISLLVIATVAGAHGGVEAREIDERVLADGSANGDYGASGAVDEGGIDILSLDLRVATIPNSTQEALVARVVLQGGQAGDHRVELSFGDRIFAWTTTDLATYTSTDFAAVAGPFDVGDGHPKALEGYIPINQLGLLPGDTLDDIRVKSIVGNSTADVMPGSWYYQGQEVPMAEAAGAAGSYAYTGPAEWFNFSASSDLIQGDATINITVGSGLTTMDQQVSLSIIAPAGIEASLDRESLLLAPGEVRSATLSVSGFGSGSVQVVLTSDLAGTRAIQIPIEGKAIVGTGGSVESALLNTGESFQYQFTAAGVFEYHCHPHPFMQGAVTIIADDANDTPEVHVIRILDGASQEAFQFSPASQTVQANDTVIWINEGAFQHNVVGSTGIGDDGHDHAHGDDDPAHGHDDEEDTQESPGLGIWMIGALLVVLAARRR